MNEDCLREILSKLGIMDLYSIATSCNRLKALAFELFQRKNKIWTINFPYDVHEAKALQARNIFKYFGPDILKLEIHFNYPGYVDNRNPNSAAIMHTVVQHCTRLKSLKLQDFTIPDDRISFYSRG